jgi:hypothetical protein
LVTSCSDVVAFLKLLKTDPMIGFVLIAIGVEVEYRYVSRSLSGWGPKGELNAPITAESEMEDLLRLLKLIWRPNSTIIAIGIEAEYIFISRSLSGWNPKRELNAPIDAGSEVADFLRRRRSCICSFGLL